MEYSDMLPASVLHWNYRGFTEFPMKQISGEAADITDIYLKENLISKIPADIARLENLESLYLSGNDITSLPREISKLRSLKCLDVSGNRLRCIPEEIGELRRLKFLILDENELRELPLRLGELRALRYLSVCDNNLEWLPQRPVYNYYHCEFRFWRNRSLRSIPYSLWYHMFRDQQTRSLSIGCLKIPQKNSSISNTRIRLKVAEDSKEIDYDIHCSKDYQNIVQNSTPPSLYELCRRAFYNYLCEVTIKWNTDLESNLAPYYWSNHYRDESNILNLQDSLEDCNLSDVNGNVEEKSNNSDYEKAKSRFKINYNAILSVRPVQYYVTADVTNKLYSFLPGFMKEDFIKGPTSRCENISCKKPVFDYVTFEFCLGKIKLIDNVEQVVLSAAFCSKSCADIWKKEKNVWNWQVT